MANFFIGLIVGIVGTVLFFILLYKINGK